MQGRVFATVGAVAALMFVPGASAHAQSGISIGANAGVAFPTGDIANTVNTGYTVGLTVGSHPGANPLGFRAEGNFSEFGWQNGIDVQHRIFALTGNLTYDLLPSGTNAIYGIGGVGVYGVYDNGSQGTSNTNWSPGFNIGGGYRFALSGFSCYLEARYHYATGTSSLGNDAYVPIVFGVQF